MNDLMEGINKAIGGMNKMSHMSEAREVINIEFKDEKERKVFEKELKKRKIKFEIYSKKSLTVDIDKIKVMADRGFVKSRAGQMGAVMKDSMTMTTITEGTKVQIGYSDMGSSVLHGLKRAYVRDKGRTDISGHKPNNHYAIKPQTKDVVGWFYNKYNSFGWVVCRLDAIDKRLLGSLTKNTFRVFTDKGTSLVNFNLEKGTYAFLDNAHYEETDNVRFERKAPYSKFIIDTIDMIKKDFGFTVE